MSGSEVNQAWLRKVCEPLSDAGVGQLLAQTAAVYRDLWNHDRPSEADAIHPFLVGLAEVRRERRQLAEAIDDALFPTVDLGEIPD